MNARGNQAADRSWSSQKQTNKQEHKLDQNQ